jgi:endonuclease YncB( thermonuclease family)
MEFDHDWQKYPELTNAQLEELRLLSPHTQITFDFTATVVKVHDGDTISLLTPLRDFVFPLRFSDIDAPELNAGGDIARDWLTTKILNQEVEIKIDPKNRVEKYGRLLGKVHYRGLDIGQEEIYLGLSKPYGKKLEGELPIMDKLFSLKQWF